MGFTTTSEFVSYQGGSGSYRSQAVTDALLLAEAKIEEWLNTALSATSVTEEEPWPIDDGKIMLSKVRLTSVQTITALHSLNCSCKWTEVTDCAVILDGDQSIIEVVDCNGVGNACWPCRCPKRVKITYTYGFTTAQLDATTSMGKMIRSAIFTAALGFLQSAIGLDAPGDLAVASWSSAGYNESRQFNERSGAEEMIHPLIQMAMNMVRKYKIRRAPGYRSRKGTLL